jgi:hypothetical protein
MPGVSSALAACLLLARVVGHAQEPQQGPEPRRPSPALAAGAWLVAQAIPSPLLVIGREHVGGGLRWQLTPLLYSFGIAERPLRTFYVTPIARHAGSIELHASPEWSCCAPHGDVSWLLRGGLRLYLPLIEHGEVLSWSFGGSYYHSLGDRDGGFAGDLGLYTLFGVFGLHVTVSPLLPRRELVVSLNIRYF